MPALQTHVLRLLPIGDVLPDGQCWHAEDAVAPVFGKNLPASQSRHVEATEAPTFAEYLPASQSRHVERPTVAEYLPAGQLVQVIDPVVVLYVPATQGVHGPAFGPVNPARHSQLVNATLAVNEVVLSGQAKQVVLELAPIAAEYFPATHEVHDAVPIASLYFP